jgi:hypothetical protein
MFPTMNNDHDLRQQLENYLEGGLWFEAHAALSKIWKQRTNAATAQLTDLGFACAFSTEVGVNAPGADPFAVKRLDCKDAPQS